MKILPSVNGENISVDCFLFNLANQWLSGSSLSNNKGVIYGDVFPYQDQRAK